MRYFKEILFVLLVIVLIAAIIAGGYAILFFRLKMQELKRNAELFKSSIVIPQKACEISSDTKSKSFSINIFSSDFEKTKNNLLKIIEQYHGDIVSTSYNSFHKASELPPIEETSYTVKVSLGQADAFVRDIRKLADPPNRLNYENYSTSDVFSFTRDCQENLERIKNLQAKETLYLNQLKQAKGDEIEKIMENLNSVRDDANYYKSQIENQKLSFNILEADITITTHEFQSY